ncbi:methyltransferase domain-containing protein [Streptomyces armeniacus]|uniref:Methyltransferase domain-containing protein n=1 Tax=Streptomyces armeniacus TaxID=83291 RepID=A0A345XNK6_9ACTN|nr:methyltransferase domain-containing protein [Streptomyces armeniacus]AXK33222.1 methyltransferase domain-containing protein [Streptomyces armeniacus]
MTPTLVQDTHLPQRARDWAEIQERMLVPLYEAVYERLDVGAGTRLLGLGCGSGLALLLAAARGATVTGVDSDAIRLGLARERLLPQPAEGARRWNARLVRRADGVHEPEADAALPPAGPHPDVVTAFDALAQSAELARTAASLERGTPVVLAGWGPPERCGAAAVLHVAARLTEPRAARRGAAEGAAGCWQPGSRDDLEELAHRSGLRLDGSGRVACPFGYADMDSAVRGLLSTGLYDDAVRATDREQVRRELAGALQPHLRDDGTVWMPNLFRYVIARA